MTPDQVERYKRHLLVKEIGGPGQKKLLGARVTVIGAGALGGQVALTLAAAGIGHIQVFDDDRVELSNLQRQTQFSTEDVGALKVEALGRRLAALNPDVSLDMISERWGEGRSSIEADLLLDGTDNFESRYQINAWSRARGIPLVSGAVAGWQGQVMLVNPANKPDAPCYRCFVPDIPPDAGNCNDLGVVGAVTTMTANQMALLTVKYCLGLPVKPGDLWLFDGLAGRTRQVGIMQDPACPVCRSGK